MTYFIVIIFALLFYAYLFFADRKTRKQKFENEAKIYRETLEKYSDDFVLLFMEKLLKKHNEEVNVEDNNNEL